MCAPRLNALELAALTTNPDKSGKIHIDITVAQDSIQKRVLSVDESYFYDMLSAFCKSLRGSDSTAALAWFARAHTCGGGPEDNNTQDNSARIRGCGACKPAGDASGCGRGARTRDGWSA